jgi:hypothetical protein
MRFGNLHILPNAKKTIFGHIWPPCNWIDMKLAQVVAQAELYLHIYLPFSSYSNPVHFFNNNVKKESRVSGVFQK